MVIIDLFKIVDLKEALKKNFDVKLHMHDGCNMQYFSFDEKPSADLVEFLDAYFEPDKLKVVFTPEGLDFHLEKL